MQVAILFLYCLWFLLTVIAQFNTRLSEIIRHYDYFKIFPTWSLFFPESDKQEYLFCYKDKINNTLTDYIPIETKLRGSIIEILYNPTKRKVHSLEVMIHRIEKLNLPTERVKQTIPYKFLLNYMKKNIPLEKGTERQFAIFINKAGEDPAERRLLITSDFYHAE